MREHNPTANVHEIEHGHWVKMSDSDGIYYACSICGEELMRMIIERPVHYVTKTPFCPNCGARMDV